MPASNRLNYARLDCAVAEAAKVVPLGSLLPILEVWIGLLEKTARRTDPVDYEFAVIDHLLANTKNNPDLRNGLVERLLNLHGTGSLARVISDLSGYWFYLSVREKNAIKDLLSLDREDKNWLKAAVLTSHNAPIELLSLVTGRNCSERLQVNDLLSLDADLLAAGFKMYTGSPQPLWWYATHHREQIVWPKTVESLCRTPNHPLFKMAFIELIGRRNNQKTCEVIKALGVIHAEVLFEIILGYFIDSNPELTPEVWEAIFSLTEDAELKSSWIKRLASNSLVIFDSLSEAKRLIPTVHLEEYYSNFSNDYKILNLVFYVRRTRDADDKELSAIITNKHLLTLLQLQFEHMPPSHYSVCDTVHNALKIFDCSDEEINFVKLARSELLDKKHNWVKSHRPEKISNWYFAPATDSV